MESPVKPIAIGADDAAYDLKAAIVDHLKSQGIAIEDYGIDDRSSKIIYPDVALLVAEAITAGKHDRGILMCGTGIGVAMDGYEKVAVMLVRVVGPVFQGDVVIRVPGQENLQIRVFP